VTVTVTVDGGGGGGGGATYCTLRVVEFTEGVID
jgi:hypothetical protein